MFSKYKQKNRKYASDAIMRGKLPSREMRFSVRLSVDSTAIVRIVIRAGSKENCIDRSSVLLVQYVLTTE